MEYIYSALLLHEAGKQIAEENVKKVLEAAGIQADSAKIKALVASLDGVDITKAIESQQAAMQVVSAPTQQAGAGKKEEKKEEAKKAEDEQEAKKTEEAAAAGLSSLFG